MHGKARRADAGRFKDNVTLLLGIQEHNRNAEAYFFEKFRPPAVSWALRQVGNTPDAEDLAHDALLSVLNRLRNKTLSEPAGLAGFVRQTVVYVAIGHLRKVARRNTYCVGDWAERLGAKEEDQALEIERTQVSARLRSTIEKLKQARDRSILKLAFFDEQPKPRICEQLDISPAQFDRIIYRAKQRLRSALEQEDQLCH